MTPLQVLHTRLTRSEIVLTTACEGIKRGAELYDGSVWLEDARKAREMARRSMEKFKVNELRTQNVLRQLFDKAEELVRMLESSKTPSDGKLWFRLELAQMQTLLLGFRIMKRNVEYLDNASGGNAQVMIDKLRDELKTTERRVVGLLELAGSLKFELRFAGKPILFEVDTTDQLAPRILVAKPSELPTDEPRKVPLDSLDLEGYHGVLCKILFTLGLPSEGE